MLFVGCVSAQTINFEVALFGKVIGTTTASQSFVGKEKTIHILSSAEAKVMFKQNTSSSDFRLTYSDGQLQNCLLEREKNGKEQAVTISWNGSSYDIKKDNESSVETQSIRYTTSEMFFTEPIGIHEVYVERFNEWVAIEKMEEGVYMTKVDGANNIYTYKDGKLVLMEIKKGVTITMTKVS